VGTEVRVLGDWGYGTRVKHGIVTSVASQNSLTARIGRTTPVGIHRSGSQFEMPSGRGVATSQTTGAAEGEVTTP
jgi:hypothetical protein